MYNCIGLPTPRGTGTNGYIQRNWANIPKTKEKQKVEKDSEKPEVKLRKPNTEILDHEKKRKLELKCMEFELLLENQGYSESEVTKRVEEYRNSLLPKEEESKIDPIPTDKHGRPMVKETHEVAKAQHEKNEVLREAFGISEYFVEGSSLDPNRRVKEAAARAAMEEEKQKALQKSAVESLGKEITGFDKESDDQKEEKKKSKASRSARSVSETDESTKKKKQKKEKKYEALSSDSVTRSSGVEEVYKSKEKDKKKKKKEKKKFHEKETEVESDEDTAMAMKKKKKEKKKKRKGNVVSVSDDELSIQSSDDSEDIRRRTSKQTSKYVAPVDKRSRHISPKRHVIPERKKLPKYSETEGTSSPVYEKREQKYKKMKPDEKLAFVNGDKKRRKYERRSSSTEIDKKVEKVHYGNDDKKHKKYNRRSTSTEIDKRIEKIDYVNGDKKRRKYERRSTSTEIDKKVKKIDYMNNDKKWKKYDYRSTSTEIDKKIEKIGYVNGDKKRKKHDRRSASTENDYSKTFKSIPSKYRKRDSSVEEISSSEPTRYSSKREKIDKGYSPAIKRQKLNKKYSTEPSPKRSVKKEISKTKYERSVSPVRGHRSRKVSDITLSSPHDLERKARSEKHRSPPADSRKRKYRDLSRDSSAPDVKSRYKSQRSYIEGRGRQNERHDKKTQRKRSSSEESDIEERYPKKKYREDEKRSSERKCAPKHKRYETDSEPVSDDHRQKKYPETRKRETKHSSVSNIEWSTNKRSKREQNEYKTGSKSQKDEKNRSSGSELRRDRKDRDRKHSSSERDRKDRDRKHSSSERDRKDRDRKHSSFERDRKDRDRKHSSSESTDSSGGDSDPKYGASGYKNKSTGKSGRKDSLVRDGKSPRKEKTRKVDEDERKTASKKAEERPKLKAEMSPKASKTLKTTETGTSMSPARNTMFLETNHEGAQKSNETSQPSRGTDTLWARKSESKASSRKSSSDVDKKSVAPKLGKPLESPLTKAQKFTFRYRSINKKLKGDKKAEDKEGVAKNEDSKSESSELKEKEPKGTSELKETEETGEKTDDAKKEVVDTTGPGLSTEVVEDDGDDTSSLSYSPVERFPERYRDVLEGDSSKVEDRDDRTCDTETILKRIRAFRNRSTSQVATAPEGGVDSNLAKINLPSEVDDEKKSDSGEPKPTTSKKEEHSDSDDSNRSRKSMSPIDRAALSSPRVRQRRGTSADSGSSSDSSKSSSSSSPSSRSRSRRGSFSSDSVRSRRHSRSSSANSTASGGYRSRSRSSASSSRRSERSRRSYTDSSNYSSRSSSYRSSRSRSRRRRHSSSSSRSRTRSRSPSIRRRRGSPSFLDRRRITRRRRFYRLYGYKRPSSSRSWSSYRSYYSSR